MKTYAQFCGVAKALDVIGERWTLLIVRDLLLGGRRYSDLLDSLTGLTTNLLAKRLAHLTAEGLVARRRLPAPSGATVYELTEAGRTLEPVVLALGTFGERYMHGGPAGEKISARWGMVSMKRRYRGGLSLRVQVRVGDDAFALTLQPEEIEVRDGEHDTPDLTLEADIAPMLFLPLFGALPLEDALERGTLRLQGRRQDFRRFARSVRPPG